MIVGVLRVLGAGAWVVVRVGLLPLDRMGHTAGAIAGGDLSHRVERDRPAHRGRPARHRAQRDARPARAGVRRARGQRGPPAALPRRRLARAAHAAGLDPRLRRAVPHGRGQRRRRTPRRPCAASRTRPTRMGVLVEDLLHARAARRGAPTPPHAERRPRRARARRGRRRARDRARPRRSTLAASSRPRGRPASPTGCVRCSRNLLRNALVHTPPGTPIEVGVGARRAARVRLEVRDHGPGLPTDDPDALFERFWRAEGGRERGRAGAGLGPGDRRRDRRRARRRGARRQRRRRRRGFVVRLPARRSRRLSGAPSRVPVADSELSGADLSLLRPRLRPLDAEHDARPASTARRPRPARRPRSTSSSPSTTRRRSSSAAIRRLHRFLSAELPVHLADLDRRQREHRRHAARSPPRSPASCPAWTSLRLEQKGRGRALRAAWSASAARGRLLHGRRPLDGPARPAAARRPAAVGPQRPRHRHPPRPRRARGARPQARAHLAHVQPHPPRGPARPVQRRPVRLQGGAAPTRSRGLLADVRDDGWFFDTELLVLAQRRGLRIHEVPVDWVDDPDSRVDIVATACDDLRGVARLAADGADGAVPRRRRPVDARLRAALPAAARRAGRRRRERRGARDHRGRQHRGQPPLHVRRPRPRGPAARTTSAARSCSPSGLG